MRLLLLASLRKRIQSEIAPQSPLKFLKTVVLHELLDDIISNVYLYTRPKRGNDKAILMAEIISVLGHAMRRGVKKDSSIAAKTGAFILYSFQELGMLEAKLGAASNGHATYIVEILNDAAIQTLWEGIGRASGRGKLPSETPYAPWTEFKHPTGAVLVKTGSKIIPTLLTVETHPIIFDSINKSQNTAWCINNEVYAVAKWALNNHTDAFSDIWEQVNPQAKTTKLRETKAILSIADKFIDRVFYHMYYLDFRGRKYPTTAYLHEQSSDIAKGLLLRKDKKTIGEEGFFWLCVSIASNWSGNSGREDGAKTDKIPLKDRHQWVMDNEEIILSYAVSPKVNQGWMGADKPWQFLAACVEFKNAIALGARYLEYQSHLECFIDGSTNGSQHLSALTRDEITAPYVNLVPLDLPGDLYSYVASHVWQRISQEMNQMPALTVLQCEDFIDGLISLKKRIGSSEPKSEVRNQLVAQIRAYKLKWADIGSKAAPVFWNRVKDIKQRRKIVKRNTMTLPYGGSSYGLGEQQILDAKKHGIELLINMEHKWGAWMGRLVFDDCKASLERPMQLLSIFEKAGRDAEKRGEFLQWNVPIVNFPVIQNYTEGKVKRVYVQYGPPMGERTSTGYYMNTLQLAICFIEDVSPSKGKQAQGAAPNVIHSLDAAHLALTTHRCDFPITTIHDSYGCLLADMPKLYRIVRETFVELYNENPLYPIMDEIEGDLTGVDMGTLDVNLITESEYAFA
jgi:DNA-directed RNA polymerase